MRLFLTLACVLLGLRAAWAEPVPDYWRKIVEEARGQTVYFNAWGGSASINDYIAWAAAAVKERFGVDLVHVKLTDTADAVSRVLVEKEAGREEGGSVDLIWINGENFRTMKDEGLLFGPFVALLPSFALVDTEANPTTLVDFGVPTDGLESPWGLAQFVLIHDAETSPEPPRSLDALLSYAEAHPGRVTYPRPPDFVGTTFLKHVLLDEAPEGTDFSRPPPEDADAVLAPAFAWLDRLHAVAWRAGEAFPQSQPALHQLFEDGEVDLTMAFNPLEAANLVLEQRFPETTRSYGFTDGSIANTHFLAIPFNASARAGAMVTAEFLLSPRAQAVKQDPARWGDATVLAIDQLDAEQRAAFTAIDLPPAAAGPDDLGPGLPEPHAAWVDLLERAWTERYGG